MGILVFILLTVVGLSVLALLLPVKIYFHTVGGTDKEFEVTGRVMVFSGLIGGGLHYSRKVYRASVFFHSWKVLDADVTSIVAFINRKAKKRTKKALKKEKIEKKEEKQTIIDRVKTYYRKTGIYWIYFKEGFHDFRDTVRFDRFSANIKLGLGNPAVTGWIIGIIYALNNILPESCVITPSYDFTRQVLRGDISITMKFISLRFWKNVIRHIPGIIRKILKHKRHTNAILTQEV